MLLDAAAHARAKGPCWAHLLDCLHCGPRLDDLLHRYRWVHLDAAQMWLMGWVSRHLPQAIAEGSRPLPMRRGS